MSIDRIVEIAGEAISGKIDDTAAIVAISAIAQAAPDDPGAEYTENAQ